MSQTTIYVTCHKCKNRYPTDPIALLQHCPFCGEPKSILLKILNKKRRFPD